MKSLFMSILLLVSFGYSQDALVEAKPEIGWDSLKSLIVYPEIARRAGVEDIARVSVEIDSLGNVTSIDFGGYGIFGNSVKSTLRKIKWIPEMYNGQKRASQIVFDVQFQLQEKKKFPTRRMLMIESSNPVVRKN
ncbi:MAG: energy transducer TonB [Bacteroidota bacterium]|nr:energy transducer TonB [Bacteroidota bacterium]